MKVQGKITRLLDPISGTSKAGKEWKKQTFILETTEQYNNIYPIEIFGEEKIENFSKYNKVGDEVEVQFNVSANEWQDKYFVSLSFWRADKIGSGAEQPQPVEAVSVDEDDDLPF